MRADAYKSTEAYRTILNMTELTPVDYNKKLKIIMSKYFFISRQKTRLLNLYLIKFDTELIRYYYLVVNINLYYI